MAGTTLRTAVLLMVGLGASVAAQEPAAAARATAVALFDRYVALERAFDPAVADLYADDAAIQNRRLYPTGEVRDLTMPVAQYKSLIRQSISIAKARNDTSTYSDCRYVAQGAMVRITCARYSELKQYTSPFTLVVGPGPGPDWLIHAELSESRP